MSVSPLPVAPAVSPAPAPSGIAQPPSHPGGTTFNAHLQSAQRQQASSGDTDADQDNSNPDSGGDPTTTTTGAQANTSTSTPDATLPSANTSQGSDAQNSDGDAIGMPTSLGSLASTVLNLIGQATGDAEDEGAAASGSKSASGDKSPTATHNTPTQAQPQPAMVAAMPPSLPAPIAPATTATGKGKTSSDGSVTALASNGNGANVSAQAVPLQPKAPGANTGLDSADDDDGGDADAVSATGDGAISPQTIGDGAQAPASTWLAGSHVASTTPALPSSAITSGNAPDLTALRGMVDVTAVAAPSGANSTAAHGLSVDAPVGSSGFAKELGQQVTWLSGQEVKQAQIRLNPQDLGPLDVKVSVDHGRVDVSFMTQHAETATAVQQGLDQLHQMLGGQGLSLGHATVGQQSAQQQFAGQQQQQAGGQTTGDADNAVEHTVEDTLQRVAVGLVDAFA